jgi:hypothetical protein
MFVGYTFRLRPFNPYYHLVASASRQERSRRAAADVDDSYNPMVDNDPDANANNPHDGSVEVAAEDRTAPLIHGHDGDGVANDHSGSQQPSRLRSAMTYLRGVVSRVRVPHPSEGPQNWDDADSAVWRPGMPLPHVPVDFAPWLDQNAPGPIVIVENPPRLDSDGHLVNDVVMARPVYTSAPGARPGYVAPDKSNTNDIPLVSISRHRPVQAAVHPSSPQVQSVDNQQNELIDLRNSNASATNSEASRADGSPSQLAPESGHEVVAPAVNGSGYSALTSEDVDHSD